MSRGPGSVERCLQAILETADRPLDTIELAARAFDAAPTADGYVLVTEAQVVSVRRALGRLKRKGKAFDLGREFRDGRRRWASGRQNVATSTKSDRAIARLAQVSPSMVAAMRRRIESGSTLDP